MSSSALARAFLRSRHGSAIADPAKPVRQSTGLGCPTCGAELRALLTQRRELASSPRRPRWVVVELRLYACGHVRQRDLRTVRAPATPKQKDQVKSLEAAS